MRAPHALSVLLVIAGLVAFLFIVMRPERVDSEAAALAARRWADGLGLRITGATCEHHRCTVAPAAGLPFVIYCSASACSLPEGRVGQ